MGVHLGVWPNVVEEARAYDMTLVLRVITEAPALYFYNYNHLSDKESTSLQAAHTTCWHRFTAIRDDLVFLLVR
jgi:hypothetical protein